MSVLKKMRDAQIGESTEDYLSKIYIKTKQEIRSQYKLGVEDLKAKKLEAFLRTIKSIQKNQGDVNSGTFSKFWSVQEQISLMNTLAAAKGEGFWENLFNMSNENKFTQGEYLEIGLSRVIKALEAELRGIPYSEVGIKKVGGAHTNAPDLINSTDEFVKKNFDKMFNSVQKELNVYKNQETKNGYSVMRSVQGKVDVVGLSGDLVLDTKTAIEQDLLEILRGTTFTLKNYVSTNDIHLGQTNPFRVFSTAAQDYGDDPVGRFSRMYNCFKGHSGNTHTMAPVYFYRIRAIYELTGSKMSYTNDALNEILSGQYVEFLVWNNPIGDIRVISTARIIKSVFESADYAMPDNWQDALYGPIEIPQKMLDEI